METVTQELADTFLRDWEEDDGKDAQSVQQCADRRADFERERVEYRTVVAALRETTAALERTAIRVNVTLRARAALAALPNEGEFSEGPY